MTSLSEVYHRRGGPGRHVGPRQVLVGIALFLVGAVMVVIGLVIASTELLAAFGIGRFESRRIAGVIGGLGLPAVFVGILTVLPASRRVRLAASIGAGIAVVGVVLFSLVYPDQWLGAGADRHFTFETTTIYFLGTLLTFWCLFVGIANFKTRNDPGGTVDFAIHKAGRTKVVEVEPEQSNTGSGVGFLGGFDRATDDGMTVSDGGETEPVITDPQDEGVDILTDRPEPAEPVDRYCGNCEHFEYTPTGRGMQPFCGFHREEMDDMEPCEEWSAHDFE